MHIIPALLSAADVATASIREQVPAAGTELAGVLV